MKPILSSLSVVALLAAGCAPFPPYHPNDGPETVEFTADSLDVYPEDVRKDPDHYRHTQVAWVGIIKTIHSQDYNDDTFKVHATIEHHYFDWQKNHPPGRVTYNISPRGEGVFKTDFILAKVDMNADTTEADAYVAPGKLAVVYGTPMGVDEDGVIKLRYRYLRVIDAKDFTSGEFDYGRLGEPVVYLK